MSAMEPVPVGSRRVDRKKHELPPKEWTVVLRIADSPNPGETYFTKDELEQHVIDSIDCPAGISFGIEKIEVRE